MRNRRGLRLPDVARPYRLACHRRPLTRRDFLGRGLLSGAAMVAGPSLLGFFRTPAARAQAANCGVNFSAAGKIPFVCFDLSGGANIAGSNVLVGGSGGQLDFLSDAGYSKLGLPATMLPSLPNQINTDLGLAFHADSAFLRGILTKASPATLANTNGAVICARSENDTSNNPHNPMYGINAAGADGALVTLIGTQSSDSGGNSEAPMSMMDPEARPTRVASARDVTGLVDTGKLVQLLNQQDAGAVMDAAEQLTDAKLNRISEDALVEQLITCAFAETTGLVQTFGDPTSLDPFNDPDIASGATPIFSAGEMNQSKFERTAAVMKLVVNGFAGAGTIQLGGYDYHDGTRATGEVRDFEAGQAMGAVLEYAARRNQQLMLYVFSDGSLDSDGQIDNSANGRGKGSWRGDNSSTAASLILVYNPLGRAQLISPASQQIGYFRPSGDIETAATPVSNNVTLLAYSIVLNYMALHGEQGNFASLFPTSGLGTNLDPLIAFQPIR
jgi:hypothetical protein